MPENVEIGLAQVANRVSVPMSYLNVYRTSRRVSSVVVLRPSVRPVVHHVAVVRLLSVRPVVSVVVVAAVVLCPSDRLTVSTSAQSSSSVLCPFVLGRYQLALTFNSAVTLFIQEGDDDFDTEEITREAETSRPLSQKKLRQSDD